MSTITPLLTRLKDKGTFVTFQSTAEDLSHTFQNNTKSIRFSKFVLMDLPNIETPNGNENKIDFDSIESVFVNGKSVATPQTEADNFDFVESLQNYALNLETLLITDEEYNANANLNVSERVFFKWLKEMGAIRFRNANSVERASETNSIGLFVEEDGNEDYSSLIKYIGEVDIEGSHRDSTNAYKELYFLIPTDHGKTPVVMFKSQFDENYRASIVRADSEFIVGRDQSDSPTAAGLSVNAQFDVDVPKSSLDYNVDGVDTHPHESILTEDDTDLYIIGPNTNDPSNRLISKTDPQSGKTNSAIISNLDGIMLEFDTDNYKHFEDTENEAFTQYNNSQQGGDFEFNAVLLYYDVWDTDRPDDISTNLYGILFLDNLEATSTAGSKITSLSKYQPDDTIRKQGNAYGIRLNLKFDITADNVDQRVEVSVNDYNTFSMLLFSEAMEQMSQFRLILENEMLARANHDEIITSLQQSVLNQATRDYFESRIGQLETSLQGFTPNNSLLDLVVALNDRFDNVLLGREETVPVTYRFNLLEGDNVSFARANNNITISADNDPYNSIIPKVLRFDIDQTLQPLNILSLSLNSLYYHQLSTQLIQAAPDGLHLYIDDSTIVWAKNKFIEIKIDQDYDGDIIIFTDAVDTQNNGQYGVIVDTIPQDRLISMRPHIKVICIDTNPMSFLAIIIG